MDYKSEGKDSHSDNDAKGGAIADSKSDDNLDMYADDSKGCDDPLPTVNIESIEFTPDECCPVSGPLELKIKFELDQDVIAGFWKVQFLVDSCDKRIIKVLGDTPVEDYPEGDSDMYFTVDEIDLSDVEPSSLTNSGLLMAVLVCI